MTRKVPFRPVHTARNSPGLSKVQITGVDVVGPDTDSDHKPRLGDLIGMRSAQLLPDAPLPPH